MALGKILKVSVLARLPRTSILLMLFSLVLLSLVFRYPLVEHERLQTDSYFIHDLSASIVDSGRAKWTISPLSYFGYYPLSYPSGSPFLLSEFSILTGLSLETCILLSDMVFAILLCLGVFVLARQFLGRPEYVLLAVTLAIIGSRFIDTTYWNGSARGPAVVLMVMLVTVLFQAGKTHNFRPYVMAFMIGLGCFAFHHLAVLMIIFAVAYVLATLQSQYILGIFPMKKGTVAFVLNTATLFLLVIPVIILFELLSKLLVSNLQNTSLVEIDPPLASLLINIGLVYTNQVGFIVPVAVIGLPLVFWRTSLTTKSLFLVTVLIAFVPVLGNHLYVAMLLAPFVSILGVLVISRLYIAKRHRGAVHVLVVLVVIGSLFLPVWSVSRWNDAEYLSGDTVEVDDDLFNDACYLAFFDCEDIDAICNVEIITTQLRAISGVRFLGSDILLTLNDEITPEEVSQNVTKSWANFPVNLYKWLQYDNPPQVEYYIKILMLNGVSALTGSWGASVGGEYLKDHSRLVVVIDNRRADSYVDSYSIRDAAFIGELETSSVSLQGDEADSSAFSSYKVYVSGRITSYFVAF